MTWYRKAEADQKMKDWFEKRTRRHIELVQKYCKKIADVYPRFKDLIARGETHDASKFKAPEMEPYVWVSWQYKCKDDGIEFKAPEGTDEKMNQATNHHVKSNKHHPEYWSSKEVNLINRKDRDKPPAEMVDATRMPDLDLAEMVADWMGMGEEKGNTPQSWADRNVNKRWKFTDQQSDLIYEIMNKVWDK
jgi:hypothetical protein